MAVAPYARITNGTTGGTIVANILLADLSTSQGAGFQAAISPDSLQATNGSALAQVGGTYSGGVFTPPAYVPPNYVGTGAVGPWIPITVAMATPYQAINPANGAHVTINFSATATVALGNAGVNNQASVYMSTNNAMVQANDALVHSYKKSFLGTLNLTLALTEADQSVASFVLPAGCYFYVVLNSGSVSIASAIIQSVG